MRVEKRHVRFYKVTEDDSYVMYRSPLGYIVHVYKEEGTVDLKAEFTLDAPIKETELIPEALKRRERAREIYKELLGIKGKYGRLLDDRPSSFVLPIKVLAED